MDWLTFSAEIVKAVAWPIAVLIIFFALRRPLLRLIPLLQRLRYGELELDFGKQVSELAVEAKKELPAPTGEAPAMLKDRLTQLAQLSPRAVVLEAWLGLEEAAIEASKRHGLKLTVREARTPIVLGEALEQADILDKSKQEIYRQLRSLRNAAVHASDFAFAPEAAIEYADLAIRLAQYLREA